MSPASFLQTDGNNYTSDTEKKLSGYEGTNTKLYVV